MVANWIGRMFAPRNGNGNGNAQADMLPASAKSIGNGASLSPLVDPDDVLTFEFGRARRYERALSIVVVSPISWPDDHDRNRGPDTSPPPVIPLLTAAGLREVLRETDIMCYQPVEGRFVLGLTESKSAAARQALERVQTLFKNRLRIDLAVGVAQFPDDGLTLDDLVSAARARAGQSKSIEVLPEGAEEAHAPPTREPRRVRPGFPELTSDAVGSE